MLFISSAELLFARVVSNGYSSACFRPLVCAKRENRLRSAGHRSAGSTPIF